MDLVPNDRDIQFANGFLQDEIRFAKDRVRLTAGTKFEYNDFTSFEVQPSERAT